MNKRTWNLIGLGLGIIGVIMLFMWGPPQPNFDASFPIQEAGNEANVALVLAEKQKYAAFSSLGLAFVLAGYVVQVLAELFAKDKKASSDSYK